MAKQSSLKERTIFMHSVNVMQLIQSLICREQQEFKDVFLYFFPDHKSWVGYVSTDKDRLYHLG